MTERGTLTAEDVWFLEGFAGDGRELLRTPVQPLPFRVGRRARLGLTLEARSVSNEHAEIYLGSDGLWVRDLGSTNGTFLNRRRLEAAAPLQAGDILHFADQEFRVVLAGATPDGAQAGTVQLERVDLPRRLLGSARELATLIGQRAFRILFQPIVALADGRVMGHETLCRGAIEGLPESPAELLALATSVHLEEELSRAFRLAAIEAAGASPGSGPLFVNTHPQELRNPDALLASFSGLAGTGASPRLVLEIHEAAVTDPGVMGALRRDLTAMGVGLAYDDFGAGRARLLELIEVPPDYLKFDIALIRDLDHAGSGKLRSLSTLVGMARELGITSVAEGIERPAEADVARRLGFDLGQGYLFGRPGPRRRRHRRA